MGKKIGKLINQALSVFGIAVHTTVKKEGCKKDEFADKFQNSEDLSQNLKCEHVWLKKIGMGSILDIGANEGQFAEKFLEILPDADYYCFEPLNDVFGKLQNTFNQRKNFHFYNFALGFEDGEKMIHRNEYSPSSSLLPMKKTHKEAFVFTRKETTEKIMIKRLDDVLSDVEIKKPYLVKIDVQGYELPVIEGGMDIITEAKIIIIETSFVTLYGGGHLFNDIYKKLVAMGFNYSGSFEQLRHPKDGKIMQQDAIFIKDEKHGS